jgi:ketosteroid isomerase-like protein
VTSGQVPEADAHPEAQRVLAANEAFYAAFNARDIAAMGACWARSLPVACVHPNWNTLLGRDSVLASWRAILENPEQPRIVAGAARSFVFERFAYVLCHELVAGSPLSATNLFALEDGEWRLVHHHSSQVGFMAQDLESL